MVLVQVGDIADLRNFQPPSPGTSRGPPDLQRAEAGGEITQLRVGQALVVKHQHGIAVEGIPDRGFGRVIDGAAQIDPVHLGDEIRAYRAQFQGHRLPLRPRYPGAGADARSP